VKTKFVNSKLDQSKWSYHQTNHKSQLILFTPQLAIIHLSWPLDNGPENYIPKKEDTKRGWDEEDIILWRLGWVSHFWLFIPPFCWLRYAWSNGNDLFKRIQTNSNFIFFVPIEKGDCEVHTQIFLWINCCNFASISVPSMPPPPFNWPCQSPSHTMRATPKIVVLWATNLFSQFLSFSLPSPYWLVMSAWYSMSVSCFDSAHGVH
jgi:hypothetical protein